MWFTKPAGSAAMQPHRPAAMRERNTATKYGSALSHTVLTVPTHPLQSAMQTLQYAQCGRMPKRAATVWLHQQTLVSATPMTALALQG